MAKIRNREHFPALIIGTGIAGLTTAFTLASAGIRVLLVTKATDPKDCNTFWAQGGIIYQGENDSPAKLVADIIRAGAGISNEEAVRFLAEEGPRVVKEVLLEKMHVPFSTTDEGELDLTQEGAHSLPRIIYAGDATGRAIENSLLNRVIAEPNITLATNVTAIDLLTTHHHPQDIQVRYRLNNECVGAYLLDNETNDVFTVFADYTVLATGGIGQIYLHTTNTRNAIGDGVVMAHRAGADLMNTEYVQFHPTALADKQANHFLISEALRGEGARLRNQKGEFFMEKYSPLKDLAPRDVVARAILEEMTLSKEEFVYLDLANFYKGHVPIAERFPNIRRACAEIGVDIEREPIPVVPAAHYFCGGILANTSGETTLPRLYAIGETSCTGLHGANRLASTSLLEGLTWGYYAAQSIREKLTSGTTPVESPANRRSKTSAAAIRRAKSSQPPGMGEFPRVLLDSIPDWQPPGRENLEDPALILQDWTTIQHTMWNYVGILRTYERLKRAVADMRQLGNRMTKYYHESMIGKPIVELFHGQQMAAIVATAALRNPVSRGAHFRKD